VLLAATIALACTNAATARAAVAPIPSDTASVGVAVAVALASSFDVMTAEQIDAIIKDAALACAADDDVCWQKLAGAAGVDVIVVGSVDGDALSLRMLDARDHSVHTARGSTKDVAAVVRALTVKPTTPPTKPKPKTNAIAYPWLFAGGAAAVVAVTCAAVGGVLEANANADIDRWKQGGAINANDFRTRNATEVGFFGVAGATAAIAIGATTVAFLE
jgi:hypothetical protein